MASKRHYRKVQRLETIANALFKKSCNDMWELESLRGNEFDAPASSSAIASARQTVDRSLARSSAATLRVNLQNVAARYRRGLIGKNEIAAKCQLLRDRA